MARIRRPGRVEPVPPVYLCVASCPTEAIKPEGDFDFFACYNHTYRDSIPGFLDLVWDLAEHPRKAFRKRWTDTQIAALWQRCRSRSSTAASTVSPPARPRSRRFSTTIARSAAATWTRP